MKKETKIMIMCPPYPPPKHGSVVYQGNVTKYGEGGSDGGGRGLFRFGGKEYPLSVPGDVPSCDRWP
jgi:hypothetical protein